MGCPSFVSGDKKGDILDCGKVVLAVKMLWICRFCASVVSLMRSNSLLHLIFHKLECMIEDNNNL